MHRYYPIQRRRVLRKQPGQKINKFSEDYTSIYPVTTLEQPNPYLSGQVFEVLSVADAA